MRIVKAGLLLVAAGLVSAGCSSDATDTNTTPDVVGTWTITAASVTNKANAGQTENLYAQGVRGTFAINANMTYTQTLTFTGSAPEVESGTWTATATTMTFTRTVPAPTQTLTVGLTVNGNTMTIVNGTDPHDFGSGNVPANLSVTMVRN